MKAPTEPLFDQPGAEQNAHVQMEPGELARYLLKEGVEHSELIEVSTGVDWYTATFPLDMACSADAASTALECLRALEIGGNRRVERTLYGYVGTWVAGSFVGVRGDSMMIQYTSARAQQYWFTTHSSRAHVSRFDVQVTCKFDTLPPNLGRAHRIAARENSKLGRRGAKKDISIREDEKGGFTLYIGAGSSSDHGKAYNKQAESPGEYDGCWRYEVVLRNNKACQMANYLLKVGNHAAIISRWVKGWFEGQGVLVLWEAGACPLPVIRDHQEPSDAERSLKWLRTQVAPTVRWLRNHYDYATLEAALMLDCAPLEGNVPGWEEVVYAEPNSEWSEHAP